MNRSDKEPSERIGQQVLWGLVAPYRLRVVVLALVSLGSAVLEAGFIVLLTAIAMSLVNSQDTIGPYLGQTLSRRGALVAAGLALLCRVGLSLIAVRISAKLSADVTTDHRQQLSHAYLRTSWDVQHSEPSGKLQELLTSFVARITRSVQTLTAAITAFLSLFAFLASGFLMDPLSTAAVLLTLGVVALVLIPLRRAIRRRARQNAEAGVVFANSVAELGALGLEMQAFGAESSFERIIDDATIETSRTQRQTNELSGALPHIYISVAYAAVLVGVGLLSAIEVGDFAVIGAILLLMLRSISYGQQLATASATLAAMMPSLERLAETTSRYMAARMPRGQLRPSSVVPIVARSVSFGYSADRAALTGVSFRLEPGEALGVIGPSGAGKSTLAQLLLGLREPTSGSLQFSGVAIGEIDHDWWTERVSFVPQDALLFTGTVAENIRFFRPGIDDTELRDAAAKANVLKDINALPDGFDTHLGQRGSQLSGGQKQRLSIARALVGSPELLILDEPTSALDGRSEMLIRDTLALLKGSMTIVIIAHRMSTLDMCDRIMVVEDGSVTALGTPDALKIDSAFYRHALAVAGLSSE